MSEAPNGSVTPKRSVPLDFELELAKLEERIDEMKGWSRDNNEAAEGQNIGEEISRLQTKSRDLTKSIFSNLKAAQIAQLARHPQRPYFMDYVERIFSDFQELHGDRAFADDKAIMGGMAPRPIRPFTKFPDERGPLRRGFARPPAPAI